MSVTNIIKSNATLKQLVHWALIPPYQAKPRNWVKWFVNPFIHIKGKGVTICSRTRMDVLPFQPFSIGSFSTIEDFATVNNGVGAVHIGQHSRVGIGNVIIGPVTIGNHVILAQNIVVSGLNHQYQNVSLPIHQQNITTGQITIEDECWIGANVVITAGVTIGKHSVVAAGAVVTKNIPAYSVAVGNPARVIKQYNPATQLWQKVTG